MEVQIANIVSRENLQRSYSQVVGNKGASGVDGMEVGTLNSYLADNWKEIKEELLSGKYKPSLVRRVSIGKPDGGVRHLPR